MPMCAIGVKWEHENNLVMGSTEGMERTCRIINGEKMYIDVFFKRYYLEEN